MVEARPSAAGAKVLAVLPNYMAARNFLLSGAALVVAEQADLVCLVPAVLRERLSAAVPCGTKVLTLPSESGLRARISGAAMAAWPGLGFRGLAYRFNERHGFVGHRVKAAYSPERLAREAAAGNYVMPAYGRPFAPSRPVYRLLHALYWLPAWTAAAIRTLMDGIEPDVVYLGQVQMPGVRDMILAARRRGVPVVGNVASWDQPTTKGPVPPHLDRYLVQSRWMERQIISYHGVPPDKISVTGWPQMDLYADPVDPVHLQRRRAWLGIPTDARVILFGLNSPRLGNHEPEMLREVLNEIERSPRDDWHLLIRPHPRAMDFLSAFGGLRESPRVSFVSEGFDDLGQLRDEIRLSSVVVSSFGSPALDAAALDRPAIYVAADSNQSLMQMEHLSSAVETGAIPVAHGVAELMTLLDDSLSHPERRATARQRLRALHLEPLDGQAGARVADAILRAQGGRT